MPKIFLTGGSGFIGKNILEQLGGAYEFVAPTHEELELTNTEAVRDFLKKNPVDIVIHTANIGGTRKDVKTGVAAINLKIFFNLVEAKQYFTQMIVFGSGAEYDKQRNLAQVSETDDTVSIPSDEYGLYKYVCAQYAEQVDYITHLRVFAVFGKYEDYEIRFISNAICKALLDIPITIRKNVKFDYLYIDDFVSILDSVINNPPQEKILNIGKGEVIDLYSIAVKILEILGKKLPITVGSDGWGNEYSPDITRLKKLYSNGKVTPLEASLEYLIEYYKKVLPSLDRNIFLHDA